jgi:hypothetical protein
MNKDVMRLINNQQSARVFDQCRVWAFLMVKPDRGYIISAMAEFIANSQGYTFYQELSNDN